MKVMCGGRLSKILRGVEVKCCIVLVNEFIYTLSTKVTKMDVKGGICASYYFKKCNLAKCYFLK